MDLLVSVDFARMIQVEGMAPFGAQDCFQRSVQWIIPGPYHPSTGVVESVIIISPYEAQELLPRIMKSMAVCLQLYATRPNLDYRPLDSLGFYTVPIPPLLILRLNLFPS